MKKTIRGRDLFSTHRMGIDLQRLPIYWKKEDILYDYPRTNSASMESGKVYIHNGAWKVLFPKCLPKERIVFKDEQYHGSYRIFWKKATTGEHCFIFRMNSQSIWQAIWFINSRVLVLANMNHKLIDNVLDWLQSNGHIKPIESVKKEAGHNIVEIHEGIPEIVFIPEPKYFCSIGCDPEFEVIKNGGFIYPPSKFRSTDRQIGTDGSGQQIELRPTPGTPEEVVTSIKRLMGRIDEPISVVGDYAPLGGHIHIGFGRDLCPSNDMLFLLDYFLGLPTINLSGKARIGYKKMSAWEQKPWGFEYRTPPAAIFANPDFARLAMKICKYVSESYINGQTFKITMPTPVKEDYLNYCNFTEEEYDTWISELSTYKLLMEREDIYDFNFAHLWNERLPETTQHGTTVCPNATRGNNCGSHECPLCFPDTWKESRQRRIRVQEEARIERLRERERYEAERIRTEEREEMRERLHNEARARRNREREASALIIEELGIRHNISWGDEWSPEIQLLMYMYLDSIGHSRFQHSVFFFGLRGDRGNATFGYRLEDYRYVNDVHQSPHSYGFARHLRIDENCLTTLQRAIDAIIAVEESPIAF